MRGREVEHDATALRRVRRRRALFLKMIDNERSRQDAKWGPQFEGIDDGRMALITGEEYGEACQAALNGDENNLREELIQLAACVLKWLESTEYRRERRHSSGVPPQPMTPGEIVAEARRQLREEER